MLFVLLFFWITYFPDYTVPRDNREVIIPESDLNEICSSILFGKVRRAALLA